MASNSKADIREISGPSSMAKPGTASNPQSQTQSAEQSTAETGQSQAPGKPKKKRPRGGKNRRKNRKQSFVAPSESNAAEVEQRPSLLDVPRSSAQQASFYRLQTGNRSNTSLESEALLDHRQQSSPRSRRQSLQQGFVRPSLPVQRHRGSQTSGKTGGTGPTRTPRMMQAIENPISEGEDEAANDRTPLLGSNSKNKSRPQASRGNSTGNYGSHGSHGKPRRSSRGSATSSRRKIGSRGARQFQATVESDEEDFDVNNPPSVPGSPKLGNLDDVMIAELSSSHDRNRDAVIDIDGDDSRRYSGTSDEGLRRRQTVADLAERDVCFPVDAGMSELGEEDTRSQADSSRARRKRRRQWPDLEFLEEYAQGEREEIIQQEQIRSKKISEPMMIGGRLRPGKTAWHREEDDRQFRFTYFNELLDGTIHARNISDLVQDGTTFRDLFLPDPVELSEDESGDEGEGDGNDDALFRPAMGHHHQPNGRLPSIAQLQKPPSALSETGTEKRSQSISRSGTGTNTPRERDGSGTPRPRNNRASKRFGPRPTFWLDVLRPTEDEMKVLARVFGIHQLTTEDILMEEEREKVELFQNYYFVNYRSFEQDKDSEDYMEPVNIYVVVFRDGVLTFHQTMTPHPANVRRRIRQLNDYMSPTADWISYAMIDDVTDVYAPLVSQIEQEVDNIDDNILYMHQNSADSITMDSEQRQNAGSKSGKNQTATTEKEGGPKPTNQGDMGARKAEGELTAGESGGDMLRRVGECRKKVMGLYRLLGNKADVIKGFAKRCNEHWEVAPRSEIGLYLGDIQDHIVTMTGNLSHYESLLSRAHSNYLAQINIRMNERAEQTNDVLGKLTVLGTIVLPMNIVTGMWGMNVWVPGQSAEGNLMWFWCITAGLLAFGLICYFIAKRVYGIV
ncbi:hypothetical protein D0867_08415 [Hortaea werneckii]|uniref:Cora-domain-containing protein n=2 Tax=Hortaea werneckii TaxID=91943 RepID=A0A3M6Z4V6_HORWE|nr:hypothetical protein D0867_08415 [Hortaea werneckii]